MPLEFRNNISLPFERVTKTPTVNDVINMCERLKSSEAMPVTARMIKKLQCYLPLMLNGVRYNQVLARDILLPQYTGGSNTYDYFSKIDTLDNKYDPKPAVGRPKCGRWLRSSARFLVCWVAEELKHEHSEGAGWHDVFDVTPEKRAPTKKRDRDQMTSNTVSSPPTPDTIPAPIPARTPNLVSYGHIYCFNTMGNPRLYKAGMTMNEDINVRLRGYQGGNKPNIIVSTMFVSDPASVERRFMTALYSSGILTQAKRMGREWFFATDDDEMRRHVVISRIMGETALQ